MMNDKNILSIRKSFSRTPGPRYIWEGDFSGELFRKTVLKPILDKSILDKTKLLIDLDGTAGYGTSFLEEAFGGLIREEHYKYFDIINTLEFKSIDESYLIEDIREYLKEAEDERSKK